MSPAPEAPAAASQMLWEMFSVFHQFWPLATRLLAWCPECNKDGVRVLAFPGAGCVALGESLNLAVLRFLRRCNRKTH